MLERYHFHACVLVDTICKHHLVGLEDNVVDTDWPRSSVHSALLDNTAARLVDRDVGWPGMEVC